MDRTEVRSEDEDGINWDGSSRADDDEHHHRAAASRSAVPS